MYPINGLPPIHPGEFIKEILQETGVSQSAFAKNLNVSPMRISHIIHGRRPVTAELAFLIGKATGQTPEYWLNLQMDYDLKVTGRTVKAKLKSIRTMAGLNA
ncbi:MAG: HigA family addiction module antitoxin [Desulfobacteraceae bacterium]|jgi:addiction module HigA family antidote|nr:HigA family addiction module antitoxin [Desulfobacteraceae bacterium]